MDDCIFCKIVKGEIPSYKIYEDSEFLAFLDIFPATEGYTLVIPKKHYRWVWDVENIAGYFQVCQKVAKHFQKITKKDGVYSMILGEEVPHSHVRLIPDSDGNYRDRISGFITNLKDEGVITKLESEDAEKVLTKYKLKS